MLTAQAWRLVGHQALMVAVCSLENDLILKELGVRSTATRSSSPDFSRLIEGISDSSSLKPVNA
ncbi:MULTISPECIES: hypothetical protein [unclassified Streptomyces]|uniref:hypothetical protein n=1 Tax=unclassified Streptomyces TaxID=2593676 RepID=UPI003804103C